MTVQVYQPDQLVIAVKDDFNALSKAHGSVEWEAEKNYAIQQLYKSNFAVQTAQKNPVSVQNAVRNLGAIGLSLNPALAFAYLVPRDNQICLDISYRGLMHLAQDTGSVIWAQCKIVHANDHYTNNGVSVEPEHKYSAFGDRGDIVGAYCVVKLADGDFLTHEMPISDIYAIRDRSSAWKSSKSGPWKSDEKEMTKKTVVKQASKYWPKVERMQKAIQVINEDSGEGIDFEAERKESVEASQPYQWAQLLIGHMSNSDSDALLDEWEAGGSDMQEQAWRHISAPDRRQIKELIKQERTARTVEIVENNQ
jgi:recombination protein RecT